MTRRFLDGFGCLTLPRESFVTVLTVVAFRMCRQCRSAKLGKLGCFAVAIAVCDGAASAPSLRCSLLPLLDGLLKSGQLIHQGVKPARPGGPADFR